MRLYCHSEKRQHWNILEEIFGPRSGGQPQSDYYHPLLKEALLDDWLVINSKYSWGKNVLVRLDDGAERKEVYNR